LRIKKRQYTCENTGISYEKKKNCLTGQLREERSGVGERQEKTKISRRPQPRLREETNPADSLIRDSVTLTSAESLKKVNLLTGEEKLIKILLG